MLDAKECITIPDCFVKDSNKIGTGHGEAKLYVGQTTDGSTLDFFENFDAKFLLRLLMENPQNLELDLEWRTADVIAGGYVDDIYVGIDDRDKFLIVTEGSYDTFIIKKTLECNTNFIY